jgi:acetyl-CoA carboxylase biotin carboxyl carrier protein
MTIDEIKELLLLFNESGVGELELQRGENRLRIRRAGMDREYVVAPAVGVSAGGPAVAVHGTAVSAGPVGAVSTGGGTAAVSARTAEPESSHILVKSPIVGTYYDAPSPGAAPFVKVGDAVEPGQVLCIIESMKLMNEIEAEVAGVVAAKLVENGRPVEYGEALLAVRPR